MLGTLPTSEISLGKVTIVFYNDHKYFAGWLSIMTSLQEWKIMFIGLEGLEELEPLG